MALYETPLSEGGELLVKLVTTHPQGVTVEVAVVGTGYGGSVAAARLTEQLRWRQDEISICVLERGMEHRPGSFPNRFSDLPGHVRVNRADTPEFTGDAGALFDVRIGEDVSVLLGNGLGGGSLINASVAEEPPAAVFDSPHWPAALRPKGALARFFDKARETLGVAPANVQGIRKYEAFAAWTKRLGLEPRRANLAVHSAPAVTNPHGVDQYPCNNCGDCFTGCNYHAKSTLPMNYLARAKGPNTKLYTGITVSHLERHGSGDWIVHFRLTPRPGFKGWQRAAYSLRARHVVLAAGSLGSTEILMRSRAQGLSLSDTLGTRFSCNGDMISAVYAQDEEVNACAPEASDPTGRDVGPTITGIAQGGGEAAPRFTVEELAVPSALRRLLEEVVTSAGLPYRLSGFDSPFAPPSRTDPLAVDCGAIDHTQVLAVMGEDGARGKLELIEGWRTANPAKVADGIATVKWAGAGLDPVYGAQDKALSPRTQGGGDYLRNPLWQPLPPEMSSQFGGKKPEGKLFTVHPLGGCPMADDAARGVVNHIGQVFSNQPAEPLYRNLLVLDGSIVPTALGINPLLTITALAERAIAQYIEYRVGTLEWARAAVPPLPRPQPIEAPLPELPARPQEQPTALRFAERVEGELSFGMEYTLKLTLPFEPVEDIPAFLRNASRKLVLRNGLMEAWPKGKERRSAQATVTGSVALLEPCPESAFERTCRALFAFLWRRGIADLLQSRREARGQAFATFGDIVLGALALACAPILSFLAGLAASVGCLLWPLWLKYRRRRPERARRVAEWIAANASWLMFVPLAYQIGESRRLRYELVLQEPLRSVGLPSGTRIVGEKVLRYSLGSNPCWQLYELPARLFIPGHALPGRLTLRVDLNYFFRRYAAQLQITRQRDLPNALLDVGSVVATLLRIIAKVHFWSFRLPEYAQRPADLPQLRAPGGLPGLQWERHEVAAPDARLRLTHYWSQPNGEPPVVLFHGLGASGNQFATPKLDINLVQHLALNGRRDVWVAEMRHSIALPETSLKQWTLDTIALKDVPRLVARVLKETGAKQVDVVAHCIGSAMFCTAALAGKLGAAGNSWIRAAVLLQVGPLITLSPGTRARAHLAAFLRRYMRETVVDFSVDSSADWIDSMIDRLLATYPYPPEEARHHDLRPPWQPNLHIANCNRWAAIDGRMIQHENLDTRMLESLGEILGPANLTTWEQTMQYAYVGRLTSADGVNYVTRENIRKHLNFPIRFIHGIENDVFAVETSRRSCQLLQQVCPGQQYDYVPLEGYSHLDPLIGRNAWRDVYPRISEFLATRQALATRPQAVQRDEILPPLIGPLVGWTRKDETSGVWCARIWCRINDAHSPAAYILVFARKAQDQGWQRVQTFEPYAGDVDTLAVFDIELDREDTDYEIFVASVHAADAHAFKLKATGTNWTKAIAPELAAETEAFAREVGKRVEQVLARWGELRDGRTTDENYDTPLYRALLRKRVLAAQPDAHSLKVALGSCRYGSSVVDRERADAVYGVLRGLVEADDAAHGPSVLLLVGDQIYADQTAGVFDPPRRRERFYEPYREAWTAPNARAVLSQVPTYMMLDDHEIADNWNPADRPAAAEQRLQRRQGLKAFHEYQLLHSPRHRSLDSAAIQKWRVQNSNRIPDHWYHFTAGGFAFFVLDTRADRARQRIISPQQMEDLDEWLRKQDKAQPKFIVSPSVVVPFAVDSGPAPALAQRSDGWDGYPSSICELFRRIWRAEANNVVFLCGDAHLSMASNIEFIDRGAQPQKNLRSYCVVSSALYAPFPFANSQREDYLPANGRRRLEIDRDIFMHYEVEPESWYGPDNFSIVDAAKAGERWRIQVHQYDARGHVKTIDLTAARRAPQTVDPAAELMHTCV
jgi:choline dehydrogenase-like flavoprotein